MQSSPALLRFVVAATCIFAFSSATPSARADMPKPPKFEVLANDGVSSISLHLWAQFRLEYLESGHWSEAPIERDARLLLRRVRPVINGKLIDEDISYQLHLSTAPRSLELMDLFVDYRAQADLNFRVGQYKIPFTRHRMNSFRARQVADWSLPTRYFGAERQYGVMAHNGLAKPPPFEYQLGVFSGVNARKAAAVGIPISYADPTPNPSDLIAPAPAADLHPEVVAHVALNRGGINVRDPSDLEGGGLRYSIGMSAAWDIRPSARQDTALRLAPELMVKYRGMGAIAAGFLGVCKQVALSGGHKPCLAGVVVSASHMIGQRYEIALRYGGVQRLAALRDDARQYGDEMIAAATDPEEIAELTARYQDVDRVRAEHELATGFNVYLRGTALKWQIDAAWLIQDRSDENRHDLRARTQLQLAF